MGQCVDINSIFLKTTNDKKSKKSTHSTTFSKHIVIKTKSQNNTPPRPLSSMLKKHHKKKRLSRLRSRSDGMLSFGTVKKSISADTVQSVDDDDDNDSISTSDSMPINSHHQGTMIQTPPLQMSPHSSLTYRSSRTPPGIKRTVNVLQNVPISKLRSRFASDPIASSKTQSIAIQRSKPLSINKSKIKPRFDVDFGRQATSKFKSSPDLFFEDLSHVDCLDDEANFELE